MMAVKKGDTVKVEYTGTLDNGEVFDSTERQKRPLEFTVGAGRVIKGFDEAVVGMEKGTEKDLHLEPRDAYGDRNPSLMKKISREKVPEGKELKAGMMVALQAPDGSQIPATIAEVTDRAVTLDLNHPLAGKALNFKIKLVDVAEA